MNAPVVQPFTAQPGIWPAAIGIAAGQLDAAEHRHRGIYPLSGAALHEQAHETWLQFLEDANDEPPGIDWHQPFEAGYRTGYADSVH